MAWSRGPADEAGSAPDECLLSNIGDDDVAFAALRTRGVIDGVTDVYVLGVSPGIDARKRKGTLLNSETLARDCTLISGQDARALVHIVIVVLIITSLVSPVIGSVTVSCCSFSF
jgi:hypothetical protein